MTTSLSLVNIELARVFGPARSRAIQWLPTPLPPVSETRLRAAIIARRLRGAK